MPYPKWNIVRTHATPILSLQSLNVSLSISFQCIDPGGQPPFHKHDDLIVSMLVDDSFPELGQVSHVFTKGCIRRKTLTGQCVSTASEPGISVLRRYALGQVVHSTT
jgi:hypothetical protein